MKDRPGWLHILVEAAVIIASILLAFGIDAAWESRKEGQRRSELIASMATDFEATRDRLAVVRARGDSLRNRARAFTSAVGQDERIPHDSLGYLLAGAFRGIHFQPVLSTYTGAVATGDLRLIETPGLLVALADFQQGLGVYSMQENLFDEFFILGAGADLRRRAGDQRALEASPETPPVFRMSAAEYWEFARDPSVHGAVQTGSILKGEMLRNLRQMDDAASNVLEELKRMR